MAWKIIERNNGAKKRKGIVLRRIKDGCGVHGYIGAKVGRRIDLKHRGFCDLLQSGSMIMIQLVIEPGEHSRSLKGRTFSLPSAIMNKYWPEGVIGKKEIMPTVDKGNLIIDLKDLARVETEELK